MNELCISVVQVKTIFTESSIVVKVGNVRYSKQGLSKRVVGEDMRWERDICGGQSNIGDADGSSSLSIGEADLEWMTRRMNGKSSSYSVTLTQ